MERARPLAAETERPPERAVPVSPTDWTWVVFLGLALVALALRLYDVGSRAIHHDESLHAVYSWYLYVGRGYTHDPMMHGPFLFHATALMYWLFGDNEVTARLPEILLGSGVVVLPWFLRHQMGRVGALTAGLLLAVEPSFVYFSRFAREDATVVFHTLLLAVGIWGWIGSRRPAYLYAGATGLALLFANKEVSFIHAFIFVSFLGSAMLYERVSQGPRPIFEAIGEIGWRRWGVAAAVFFGITVVLYTTFFTNLDGLCTMLVSPHIGSCGPKLGALEYWLSQQEVARGAQPWFYYLMIIPLYEIIPLALAIFALPLIWWRGNDGPQKLSLRPDLVAGAVIAAVGIVAFRYGHEPVPQTTSERAVYHLLQAGFFVAAAVPAGLIVQRRFSPFVGFCAWWALLALVIYSWAGEKMPWLIVHPVLPLVLLAGIAVERLTPGLRRPWGLVPRQWAVTGLFLLAGSAFLAWLTVGGSDGTPLEAQTVTLRRISLALMIVGILTGAGAAARSLRPGQLLGAMGATVGLVLVSYSIHTGWQLNYKNGDTPVEMLVYVQSAPDVPFVVSELERLGNQLGLRKDVPILLDGGYSETVAGQNVAHEAISWPFEWYLRDFKGKQYFSRTLPSDFSTGRYAAVLVMGPNLDPVKDQLAGYTGNKLKLNWWYPEDYKQLTWDTLLPGHWDPGKVLRYVMYRELVNPPDPPASGLGAREFWFYVRNDLVGSGERGAVGPAPAGPRPAAAAPPGTEELAVRETMTYGRVSGAAVLRDPKGIAVDSEGRVYVVDGTNANVTVFNRDGSVARTWGRKGVGDGEFTEPWGIAVASDGSVFVADTWNHRIQKFDSQGRFLTKWGQFIDVGNQVNASPNGFFGPRDVVITQEGRLLVMDTGNERIQVFDQQGGFVRSLGGEGRGPGQFREPVGLAVDASGLIYVADAWNQRVQVLSAQLEPLTQYPLTAWSSQAATHKPYLTVAADGAIYATVPERGSVVRIRDSVATTLSFGGSPRAALPIGIRAVGEKLYVSDAQNGVVLAYELAPDVSPEAPAGNPSS
jgi:uncharacterized protein (TIGR03663 family)